MGKENSKTEEEIRKEVKEELKKEQEIKEEVKRELRKEEEAKNKRKRVFRFIWNTIVTIVVLVILFLTVMGVLDMQRLNDEKEPYWYMSTSTETVGSKTITKYDLALYVITKTVDGNDVKIVLKPFFIKD